MSPLSLLFVIAAASFEAKACSMTDDVCEFWLVIEDRLNMMNGNMLVKPSGGNLYNYDVVNTTEATPVNVDDVITADGYERQRHVIVINGTLPGPTIEVYKNQEVIIHVQNNMLAEGLSIHWHGVHQQETPWMDGVAYVTQCPIMPRQSFTYKFKAYPEGTFWYHSHVGSQRTMGVYGAIIIREIKELEMPEFIMILQDWDHDMDSATGFISMLEGMYIDGSKYMATKSLDGVRFSMFNFQSGLINGRGRYHDPETDDNNEAPLEIFKVEPGKNYRFRVISAGNLYPFRISIDNHPLTIVASDGFELVPETVESFIINPGERFDFIINTTEIVANYWIRAPTLEIGVHHVAEAILSYNGSDAKEPNSTRQNCTQNNKCTVLNCPFIEYPYESNVICKRFDELRSSSGDKAPVPTETSLKEYFLNFASPGSAMAPGAVNGHTFLVPPVSALSQPQMVTGSCDDDKCGEQKVLLVCLESMTYVVA